MKQLAEGVYLIEGLRGANVYLLVSESELTLVDGGIGGDADRIVAQLKGAGFDPSEVASIVVTHAHADHVGGVKDLAQKCNAKVIAHREEVPYIEGKESLPARSWVQKAMKWIGGIMPLEGPGVEVARGLEEGERLDALGGLEVIHTPGHTPGSVTLYQEEKGVLLCGDLLTNGNPLTGRGGLQYGPRAFSVNPGQMERSAKKLSSLEVRALCVGHGEPIVRDDKVRMGALLDGQV